MNENYRCEICDSETLTPLHTVEMMFGGSESFLYLKCESCETTYQANKLDDYSIYYPKSYYSFQYREPTSLSGKIRRLKRKLRNRHYYFNSSFIGRILAYVKPCPTNHLSRHVDLRKDMSILEIGCGSGEMLHELGDLGINRLIGADPYVESEIRFDNGVIIHQSATVNLPDKLNGEKFDLIIFNHSFEHSLTPLNDLAIAKLLLKKGGQILIRLPVSGSTIANIYKNFWWSLDAPRHIYIFSRKSMALVAGKLGLRVAKTHFEGTIDDYLASEQHKIGIRLMSEESYVRTKDFSRFTPAQLAAWNIEITRQNSDGTAAQAGFVLEEA